jgi:GNAT superfamily N-acetyltransferase
VWTLADFFTHPRSMTAAPISIREVKLKAISALRDAYRVEQDCQIVHDSLHTRRGWTREFAIAEGDRLVAYASLAVDGPWRNKPTLYELYVVPDQRSRAFALFEAFLDATRPHAFEVQSNDLLLTALAVTFARELATEKVVFRDHETTSHTIAGATLRCLTSAREIRKAMAERAGGGEWVLEVAGTAVGKGGILFHYNPPYGDIYMEVDEPYRRRGYGGFLVQELKRLCRELGAVPGARCDPTNTGSRRTLQRAGFVPYAHILVGTFSQTAP